MIYWTKGCEETACVLIDRIKGKNSYYCDSCSVFLNETVKEHFGKIMFAALNGKALTSLKCPNCGRRLDLSELSKKLAFALRQQKELPIGG